MAIVRQRGLRGLTQGWCVMEECSGESPEERIARYAAMADRAHQSARNATTIEARNSYISIAMLWGALADELEDEQGKLKLTETLTAWAEPLHNQKPDST